MHPIRTNLTLCAVSLALSTGCTRKAPPADIPIVEPWPESIPPGPNCDDEIEWTDRHSEAEGGRPTPPSAFPIDRAAAPTVSAPVVQCERRRLRHRRMRRP